MQTGKNTDTYGFDAMLSEKERVALFNIGRIQVLSEGQPLLTREMNTRGVFLVLNGAFRSTGMRRSPGWLSFGRGDLIWGKTALDSDPSLQDIRACEASRVLYLHEAALDTLGRSEHTGILKLMSAYFNSRALENGKQLASDRLKRDSISQSLLSEYENRKSKYENSELILGLMKRIPRLPIHVAQLFQMLLSEKISAKRVTELAKQDPSLVSEVLKTVNSANYGLRQKVSDLYYAIMLIGFNEVYQILISSGVRRIMPDTDRFRAVHQHSLILSYIALEICHLVDKKRAAVLSTIGLLHDIGKSTILLIEKENPKLSFFIQMLNPCKVGAMLLAKWNIPQVICETIEYQDHARFCVPGEMPSQYAENVGILHIAHAVHDIVEGGGKFLAAGYPFLDEYRTFLKLNGSFEGIVAGVMKSLKSKTEILPDEVKRFTLAGA